MRIHIGLSRSYRNVGNGCRRDGPWEVIIDDEDISSRIRIEPDMAQEVANAVLLHAAEAKRRNDEDEKSKEEKIAKHRAMYGGSPGDTHEVGEDS